MIVDERLLCRCHIACSNRATQEDGYCDECRDRQGARAVGHSHTGDVGAPPGSRMKPLPGDMAAPFSFEFNVGPSNG